MPRTGRSALDYETIEGISSALMDCKLEEKKEDGVFTATPVHRDWILPAIPPQEQASYKPQDPIEEANRLAILRDYLVLESGMEQSFDQVTEIAGEKFHVPWAIVSFVDMGRQWFKSIYKDDLGLHETAREHAFCSHTIQSKNDIFVVPNAAEDSRFASNPLVNGTQASFKFYAGVPLQVPEGARLGTLCILDRKPRANGLTVQETAVLKAMAKQTVDMLCKRKDALWKQHNISRRTTAQDKLPVHPTMHVAASAPSKHVLSPRPADGTKRTRIDSTNADAFVNMVIQRPNPKQPMLLPDPRTDGIDPDTYLSQLVEAIYGAKLDLKTGIELGDFFPAITDEQESAYSLDVVNLARNNDVVGLKEVYVSQGRDALDCFNRFGEGLLNLTCRRGFKESVFFLLSDKVDLNVRVRDDFGRTPLHDACWNPEPLVEICTKLMEKDPSLFFITDKRGYTPFQYARKTDWPLWRKFLFDRRELLAPLMSPEIKNRFSS